MSEKQQKLERHRAELSKNRADSDEIDLFELFHVLWKKKILIIVITLFTTLLSAAYAFTAKEQWTAKAYLIPPRVEQIQSFIDVKRDYARILGESVDVAGIANQLFSDFINFTNSSDLKMQFLRETDYFKQATKDLTNEGDIRRWLLEQADKSLLVNSPNEKKGQNYYIFSMQAQHPDEARLVLEQYIAFINQKSFAISDYEFADRISALKLSLEKEKSEVESTLKIARENSIEYVSQALSIAKMAGIKNYHNEGNNVQVISNIDKFMLGERFLDAELSGLKSSPTVYPYRYYQIIEQLEALNNLTGKKTGKNQVYRYQMMPEEPTTRDAPKRSLFLVLGALLGGMLGIGFVLVQSAITNYKK